MIRTYHFRSTWQSLDGKRRGSFSTEIRARSVEQASIFAWQETIRRADLTTGSITVEWLRCGSDPNYSLFQPRTQGDENDRS